MSVVNEIRRIHATVEPQPESLGLPLDHRVMLTDAEVKQRSDWREPPLWVDILLWVPFVVLFGFLAVGIVWLVVLTW